mmetsp:Transcript_7447/g.17026  ORF Transcript_7447/g.17026 Transcript_7447/m.17026 type:complete len:204 (-) Transcript_7447:2978-3589(-)
MEETASRRTGETSQGDDRRSGNGRQQHQTGKQCQEATVQEQHPTNRGVRQARKEDQAKYSLPQTGKLSQALWLWEDETPAQITHYILDQHGLPNIFLEHRDAPREARPKFPTINIFGVVLGFGVPTLTKTNNWMVSLTIVDDSLPLPHPGSDEPVLHSVTINIFSSSKEDLPKFHQAGDVIRLHNAGLQVCQLHHLSQRRDVH